MVIVLRFAAFVVVCILFSCSGNSNKNKDIDDVAGNDEVLTFMKSFEGRGDLTDTSHSVPASEALKQFKIPTDLELELVLSEPQVTQPVFITFDPQGRLWVVQYNQYPYPEGLKVTSMDQHTRARFDKEPLPPPSNERGADKITMFEDTDQNGTFEKSTDVITGLNLITSVAFGRGQIWVLNPPYLLAYPDADHNGIPDGAPVVHLKGFGIEDTHALANNLRFGPDGWLYGAQGSTCTANVISEVSKNVHFNGQAIWRYHPQTKVFEIFAEGGGNTFDVEIDEKGRLYSGDNGTTRGQYYKQGAYFTKNLGKHGAFTNPYTFGYLPNMALHGEETRFTHAFVKYGGNSLPSRYNDRMIAINPLQSYVQLTRFETNGSSFKTIDEERIMQTDDHWFRPVDIIHGPDGNVYIADWYDSRISHVDPRDTWDKNSGRIYMLKSRGAEKQPGKFDLFSKSDTELMDMFTDKNIWFRQHALLLLGDRKNSSLIPYLMQRLQGTDGQQALEALWAINLSGGFVDDVPAIALHHADPFVRMWAVRLIGDSKNISPPLAEELVKLSLSEKNSEVRSQLAATAKRMRSAVTIGIVKNLLENDDSADPDIPLQIWWAIESVAVSNRDEVIDIFKDKSIWANSTINKTILSRLIQRYIIAGGEENNTACAKLFDLAPSENFASILFAGLQEGLRGRDIGELSPALTASLKPYKKLFSEQTLSIDLRIGEKEAVDKALAIIQNNNADAGQRLSYIRIFSEINQPGAIPVLLNIVETSSSSPAYKQAALFALQNYNNDEIGERVVKAYPDKLRDDYDVREAALALFASRALWAKQLINAVTKIRTIDQSDVPEHIIRQLKMLNDDVVSASVDRVWPNVKASSADEKNKIINQVAKALKAGGGDVTAGHPLYAAKCGACHKLFNEGRNIGPDLTGYDRDNISDMLNNIVDPSAYIREGYSSWHVTTKDGRTVIGTLKAKNDKIIAIQPFTGETVTIGTAQLKSLEQMETSVMPERLLEGLNDKQLRDLFSYIMKK